MRKIFNKLQDSAREILQIMILILTFLFPRMVNLSEVIRTLFGGQKPDFSTVKYYYLMESGNLTIGILMCLYVLINFVRKSNKDVVFNKGNRYHDHPYIWYWFCSKVLGYENCNLILVPIHMQMKLVIRDTFRGYPFSDDMFPKAESEVVISKQNILDSVNINEVNLILEDTYPIFDEQIKPSDLELPTIRIRRKPEDKTNRVYSGEYVDKIVAVLRDLPEDVIVNIFATINPKHCYEIAKKGIALGGRSNLKQVNVFQQKGYGKREFVHKYKIL